MFHRFQKSRNEPDRYGALKLIGSSIPNNKAKAMAKYVEDEQGNVERFEMTRVYDDKMLRLDFANPAISHRLADATKYNDDFLDDLFKEFG